MGVPKFFRWLSERYPALLTRVNAYDIPDVDNFYLDMNGIIHSCSHPNDDDANAFISDAKIFEDVFAYIDALVRIIKPRRLLFLAIDGVAPRAKMNQQRSRRFRTARMAEQQEMEARQRGEWKELQAGADDEKRFDSNTITPGTDFMCRLDEHLQYYIQRQANEDPLWRQLKVIYSSHLTPGEGEHKIMDYIRYARSKSNYDVLTRHCLYGLDADLIMLGMASHEPYFTLLREEVKFGAPPSCNKSKDSKQKPLMKNRADQITFFLLHLSLLRGYLAAEFQDLKAILAERFDMESLVDDWVFMNMLVGNDFIPHLPFMHINKGSLQKFYDAYRRAIPEMGGYINQHGVLHLDRFMIFIRHIAQAEQELMSEAREDDEWLMSKRRAGPIDSDDIWDDIADEEEGGAIGAEFMFNTNTENADPNAGTLVRAVLKRPAKLTAEELEQAEQAEFDTFASDIRYNYYKKKFCLMDPSDDDVKTIAHELVRALVWNLGYYYSGVQSWEWYYPYHYSPYASDIWRVCSADQFRDIVFDDRGRPFMPFEQLMAVLPARSKPCLPVKLRQLFHCDSSIYDFYPTDFLQDMDDKQNDWEAVVCVPFVDERRLVHAVAEVLPQLSDEEKRRNAVQPSYIYTYVSSSVISRTLTSPNVRKLPNIASCGVRVRHLSYEQMQLTTDRIRYGVLVDVGTLNKYRKGYPQLNFIRFTSKVAAAGVKVFMHSSKSLSVVLKVEPVESGGDENAKTVDNSMLDGDFNFLDNTRAKKSKNSKSDQPENLDARIDAEIDIGCDHLGRDILVDWPYLYEARVERVIDGLGGEQHVYDVAEKMIKQIAYDETVETFTRQMGAFGAQLKEKLAIDIGRTCVAVNVRRKIGYQLYYDNAGRTAQFQPQYEKEIRTLPLQICVPKDLRMLTIDEDNPINACGFAVAGKQEAAGATSGGEVVDVRNIFKQNDLVFCTVSPFYGAVGQVQGVIEQQPSAQQRPGAWGQQIQGSHAPRLMVRAKFLMPYEHDMIFVRQTYQDTLQPNYYGARELSQYLQMHPKLVSAFTGTLYVVHSKLPGANINRGKQSMHGGNDEYDAEDDELDPVAIAGMRNTSRTREHGGDMSLKNVAKSNIGLNLKKNKTGKEIRGYSFKDLRTTQWLYSDRVVDVLSRWRDRYPAAVDALSQNLGADIRVDLLFADKPDPMEALREMRQFINDLLPDSQRVEQSSGSDYIDDKGIAELRRSRTTAGPLDNYTFSELFKPQHLYKFMPNINDNAPPDSRPTYRIWDRVVNARPNCAVPIGIRGTVVCVEYEETENNSNNGGGNEFDRRNNNYNSQPPPQQQQQQLNSNERRQRLIQVLWDENFKVNGVETDLHELPPSYLINISYGRKLKDFGNAYNNVRTQRTTSTVHDLLVSTAASSRQHKLPVDDDADESPAAATTVRRDQPPRSVAASSSQHSNTASSSNFLNQFLQKSFGAKIKNEPINDDSDIKSPSAVKSEALLVLEGMIAATNNNDRLPDDSNDAVVDGGKSRGITFCGEVDSDNDLISFDAPDTPAPTATSASSNDAINFESSEQKMNKLLTLLQKKPVDGGQEAQQQQAATDDLSANRKGRHIDNFDMIQKNAALVAAMSTVSKQHQQRGTDRSSPSKKGNARLQDNSGKKMKNDDAQWVNSFRDDYFEGEQTSWHAPPVEDGGDVEGVKDNAAAFRGGRDGRYRSNGASSAREYGGNAMRGASRAVGRGNRVDPTDESYNARAQRLVALSSQQRQQQRGGDSRASIYQRSDSNRQRFNGAQASPRVAAGNVEDKDGEEWKEEWSQPLSTFVASRGPRSQLRGGGRGGFSRGASYSPRGGRPQQPHYRSSLSRNVRVDDVNDADDDDEDFGSGQWQQVVRPRAEQNRRPNYYADDGEVMGSVTMYSKQPPPLHNSNLYSDANRSRFVHQRPQATLTLGSENWQQQNRSQQQRRPVGGFKDSSGVPMPSNAAECVVYSVDDDYNNAEVEEDYYAASDTPTGGHRPRADEAVYAPPVPLDFEAVSPGKDESQLSTTATGTNDILALLQQLSNSTQVRHQKPPANTSKNTTADDESRDAMNEALEQLENLNIELAPPRGDDEFGDEMDEENDVEATVQQQNQRPIASSREADKISKMFSLGRNMGGINFISGGFLQSQPAAETAVNPPFLPPSFASPVPSLLLRPRPPTVASADWRGPVPPANAHGVDPAVRSAGVGVLHYHQPPTATAASYDSIQQAEQQAYMQKYHEQMHQFYQAQAAQAAQAAQQQMYMAFLQQQQEQQYQQQQPPLFFRPPAHAVVPFPPMPPVRMSTSGAPAMRQPLNVQYSMPMRPPTQAQMFAMARAQAFATARAHAAGVPGNNFNGMPSLPPRPFAGSPPTSRPTMSMIPRSALLRNSISRRPESNLANVNDEKE